MPPARLVSAVTLPAEYESLTFARAVVERALLSLGWEDDATARIVLAAAEGVCNAIEHGSERGAEVDIELWADDDSAFVRIADLGRNGSATPVILPSAPPRASESRGRGLVIMSRLSSELEISGNNGGGTTVVLTFNGDVAEASAAEVA